MLLAFYIGVACESTLRSWAISTLERRETMFELAIISIIGFVLLLSSTLLSIQPPKQEHDPAAKYQAVRQQMKSWPW